MKKSLMVICLISTGVYALEWPTPKPTILDLAALGYANAMRDGPLTDNDHLKYQYRMRLGLQVDRGQMDPGIAMQLIAKADERFENADRQNGALRNDDLSRRQAEIEQQRRVNDEQAERNRRSDLFYGVLGILRQGAEDRANYWSRQQFQPLPTKQPIYCSTFRYGPNQTSTTCY